MFSASKDAVKGFKCEDLHWCYLPFHSHVYFIVSPCAKQRSVRLKEAKVGKNTGKKKANMVFSLEDGREQGDRTIGWLKWIIFLKFET